MEYDVFQPSAFLGRFALFAALEACHDRMQIGLEWHGDQPSYSGWSLELPFFHK